MVHPAPTSDATLAAWLASHARVVSTRRLVLDIAGGAGAGLVVSLWRPTGWPALLGAAFCFVAFGAWALAERRLARRALAMPLPLSENPHARDWPPLWRGLRGVAAVTGVLAAMRAVFGVLFGVLGTWIS